MMEPPRTLRGNWPLAVLLLAPVVAFAPILFGGYTISQSVLGADFTHALGGQVVPPVFDPNGALDLDEPMLRFHGQAFARGKFPMVNLGNGMGAPTVESVLIAPFYPLLPLVALLPNDSPWYFDIYCLLHVYVGLLGFHVFLRRYGEPFEAAAGAMLVILGGVTYGWFTQANYRTFVWLPWMLAGAVSIVRGQSVRRHSILLCVAGAMAVTAGNPQEFFMDMMASAVILTAELAAARERKRRLLPLALCFAVIALIGLAVLTPFLSSSRADNLFANTLLDRSAVTFAPVWFLNWLIPHVEGRWPAVFFDFPVRESFTAFSTVGFLLLVGGVVYGWRNIRRAYRNPSVVCCLLIPPAIVLGLCAITDSPLNALVQRIPVIQRFLLVKYHLYLYALASVLVVVGLRAARQLDGNERRKWLAISSAIFLGSAAGAVWYLRESHHYAIPSDLLPAFRNEILIRSWMVPGAVAVLVLALLFWRPKWWQPVVLALLAAQGASLLPIGWGQRRPAYLSSAPAGVDLRGHRTLMELGANQNLFGGVEALSHFDAVTNRAYRLFLYEFFALRNGGTYFQPVTTPLTPPQVSALRVAGVSRVLGYPLSQPGLLPELSPGLYAVPGALPRLFLISEKTFAVWGDRPVRASTIDLLLETIGADLAALPQPRIAAAGDDSFNIQLPAGAHGKLILNQGYSTAWKLDGVQAESFVDLWPVWKLDGGAPARKIAYRPPGLDNTAVYLGLALVLFAVVLVLPPAGGSC